MSWTQPMCASCWVGRWGEIRQPCQVVDAEPEVCAWCGFDASDGIYVRENPANVPFPAGVTEEPKP